MKLGERLVTLVRSRRKRKHRPTQSPDSVICKIPLEIWEQIIDLLHDDRSVLAACALTCSVWLPRVRNHLFKRIYISPTHFTKFAKCMKSSPDVGHNIRDFTIYGFDPMFSESTAGHRKEKAYVAWFCSAQTWLPARLSGVHTLTMYNEGRGKMYEAVSSFCLTTITTLVIVNCVMPSPDVLLKLLHSLPCVECLQLLYSRFSALDAVPSATARANCTHNLKLIRVAGSRTEALSWLVPKSPHRNLEALSCSIEDWIRILEIRPDLASDLQRLDVSLYSSWGPRETYGYRSLSTHFPSLVSLALKIRSPHEANDAVPELSVLRTITTPLLSIIRVFVELRPPVWLNFLKSAVWLDPMCSIIPRLQNLQEIIFEFHYMAAKRALSNTDVALYEIFVLGRLPNDSARKLVRFNWRQTMNRAFQFNDLISLVGDRRNVDIVLGHIQRR